MKTRFIQSVVFNSEDEQFHYDQIREIMLNSGFKSVNSFINTIKPSDIKIDKKRFNEIVDIAKNDYMAILSDPFGLQRGF